MRTPKFRRFLKTLEAWIRGYVLFRVNGERFFTYSSALERRKKITTGSVEFVGLHVLKGWRTFFLRWGDGVWIDDQA